MADSDTARSRSLGLCVPILKRTEKLRRLLESISGSYVDSVYIADNGDTESRDDLYAASYPFDLEVLDLPYDCGIGEARAEAAAVSTEEYLMVVDNDMIVPDSVWKLVALLEADDLLGGVSGILSEYGDLRSGCCNLHEETLLGGQTALIQEIRDDPSVEWYNEIPLARFDKLTNATVFRRECIESYGWDPDLKDIEHLDFYLGHKHRTDWEFGVCPEVVFRHFSGGDQDYEETFRHGNDERQRRYRERVKQKWGYDRLIWGDSQWFGTGERSTIEDIATLVERALPARFYVPVKDVIQ